MGIFTSNKGINEGIYSVSNDLVLQKSCVKYQSTNENFNNLCDSSLFMKSMKSVRISVTWNTRFFKVSSLWLRQSLGYFFKIQLYNLHFFTRCSSTALKTHSANNYFCIICHYPSSKISRYYFVEQNSQSIRTKALTMRIVCSRSDGNKFQNDCAHNCIYYNVIVQKDRLYSHFYKNIIHIIFCTFQCIKIEILLIMTTVVFERNNQVRTIIRSLRKTYFRFYAGCSRVYKN